MLRSALFVLLAAVSAFAGENAATKVIDRSSGLEVVLPEGWTRRGDQENRSRPIVAVYAVGQGRFVQFVAEISSADRYDADEWVATQKQSRGKWFDKVDNPLSIEERKLGKLDAIGYSMSGSKGGKALRIRVYHVVRDGRFFQFTEASFENAHTDVGDALDAIWDSIAFGDADAIQLQEEATPGKARVVEDTLGNYKIMLPGNWELERAPPTDANTRVRIVLLRRDEMGNTVSSLQIIRFESSRAETFTEDTPGDVIQSYVHAGNLEGVYGENASPHLAPDIDESTSLGGADKGAKWKISSITMTQKAKRKEAQTRKRRGEKNVEIPKFKPAITRGRCAMVSPYLYHVWAQLRADVGEDAKLNAEITKIFDSFEFLQSGALPPALNLNGFRPGNTVAVPEFAKARKESVVFSVTGNKVYKLGISMLLPPGFQLLDKKFRGSGTSVIIVVQDEKNNWAKITIGHQSIKALGEQRKIPGDKKTTYASWKSNWETKARGKEVPEKVKKVAWGKAKGKGYKLLMGDVSGWPGSFTGILFEKSGWRTYIEVETRGLDAERFMDDLDAFFKKLKFNYKVK